MSKIKNAALDQYGAKPFKQQQFGTAGTEGVKYTYLGDLTWTARPCSESVLIDASELTKLSILFTCLSCSHLL